LKGIRVYESFYHLQAKPFRLSPDPGFFFESRGHKRALAYLRYGLNQGEGFVVITGAPGTGKTTLAQILLREMNESDMVVAHLTTTQLEADDMLRMVAASFGLRYEGLDKTGLLKTLEAFLLARSRERKRALLVVDEAQNLPARSLEELRMLSNLQVADQALLQTFLLGQTQFRQMLEHPDLEQLRQRVIANYHLGELAQDECASYIESRLRQVGWTGDPHFTECAYEVIYEYTEGVPRRINMLCDRIMLFGCLEECHKIDAAVLREVTDELQQEVSGRPPAAEEMSPVLVEAPRPAEGVEVELDVETHDSLVQTEVHQPVTLPLDDSMMDRVVPDSGWNQSVVQARPDATDMDEGEEPQEKDRFRVISGGKDDRNGNGVDEALEADPRQRPANNPTSVVMAPVPDAPGDSEEVVLRKILRLVLAFHRSPRSFPGLDDPAQPLPKGVRAILTLAVSEDSELTNLRQIAVMGISPDMLRAAVRFFVRRVMFMLGSDGFRVLGLPSSASQAEVELHYGLLMRLMRQEKQDPVDGSVARIGEAYERLCRAELIGDKRGGNPELGDIADADIADIDETLDLDLAPSLGAGDIAGRAAYTGYTGAPADIVHGGGSTGTTLRNLVLVVGAVVIAVVLYFTQVGIPFVDAPPAEQVEIPTTTTTQSAITAEQEQDIPIFEPTPVVPEQAPPVVVPEETPASAETEQLMPLPETPEILAQQRAEEEIRLKAAEVEAGRLAELRAVAAAKLREETEARAAVEARAREAKAQKEAQARAVAKAEAERKAVQAKQQEQARQLKQKKPAMATTGMMSSGGSAADRSATAKRLKSLSSVALNARVDQFKTAFQQGQLDRLMALFSPQARTDKQSDLAGIKAEYQALIEASDSRRISINELDWNQTGDFATGTGRFRISLMSKEAGKKPAQPTVTTGEVTLQMKRVGYALQITRLYFSHPVQLPKAQPPRPVNIAEAELDQLIGHFVRTYEKGDIEAFMSLFAQDAQSNDQSTVAGIRQDYVDLFTGTAMRKLVLSGIKWDQDGEMVRGESQYEVKIQANGRGRIDTYKGMVWFQVERRAGEPRITHFAFVE
jgi:putative secretion ATPase (PEP-CTERM system associated)